MWRTLLKPRWLLLLGVLVAIVVGFAQLGLWQLSVARDDAAEQSRAAQAALEVVPLGQVIAPHQAFPPEAELRPVAAEGRYDAARQFLIPGRLLDGEPGLWVVTPLQVGATGADLAVVRGFVTAPDQAQAPPAEPVRVTGALAPGESPSEAAGLPSGQRASLDLGALVNAWPGEVYNAFVFAATETGPDGSEVAHPTRIPPPVVGGEVDWRNLGYALQWWVFAAFAVFMYWRLLREDHLKDHVGPRHTLESPDERTSTHHV